MKAFFIFNEALQWVKENKDELDISELAEMIDAFVFDETNDYENISATRNQGFLKVKVRIFYHKNHQHDKGSRRSKEIFCQRLKI